MLYWLMCELSSPREPHTHECEESLLSIKARKILKTKSFGELKISSQEEKDYNDPEHGIWTNGEELRPEGTIVL